MTIFLKDIWQIERPVDYKVHFARKSEDGTEPLEVFIRDRREWQGWQEYWPKRNDFNRPYIFSLIRFITKRIYGCSVVCLKCWSVMRTGMR